MSDPNPYQPPQTPEPLTKGKVIKRAVGVGVVLLLTPIAVAIAFTLACTTASFAPALKHPLWHIILRFGYLFVPPFLVLSAMLMWAARIHLQQTRPGERGRRVAILLFTPVAVVVATAVSFGLTYLYVEAPGPRQFDSAAMIVGCLLFFAPPSLALIGMLLWAWNHDA
jgi:hypothetical protein